MPKRLPILQTLPPMRCDQGCTECCSSAFPISEREMLAVVLYANANDIAPRSQGKLCPWYGADGRCSVYEARPIVCELYGHVDHPVMTCPKGYNENVDDPRELEAALRSQGRAVRFMHEVLPDVDLFELVPHELLLRVDGHRAKLGLEPFMQLTSNHEAMAARDRG